MGSANASQLDCHVYFNSQIKSFLPYSAVSEFYISVFSNFKAENDHCGGMQKLLNALVLCNAYK